MGRSIQYHFKNSSNFAPNTYENNYAYQQGTHRVNSISNVQTVLSETYQYDLNGNTTNKTDAQENIKQFLWDESNRLCVVDNDRSMQHYIYDAAGERVLKANSDRESVYQNGTFVDEQYSH